MPDQDTRITRPTSPALDQLLGQTFPLLNDGFVRVVDYMGTDASIVQAARVSYGAGTKKVSEFRGKLHALGLADFW
jgi:thymidylate synthase (FAD)